MRDSRSRVAVDLVVDLGSEGFARDSAEIPSLEVPLEESSVKSS